MTGRAISRQCFECAATVPDDLAVCRGCGGTVLLNLEPADTAVLAAARRSPLGQSRGIWAYAPVLPATEHRISLGEGLTPLAQWAAPAAGNARVWLKQESLNPTLSFKDRGMALAASVAKDRGLKRLVVASTGNSAVSAAAYAAAADLQCTVVVGTKSQAAGKLAACRAYGAEVQEVPGDFSDAYAHSREMAEHGAFNVSTTYQNPVLTEAYRTISLELLSQLGRIPEMIIIPVGAGPLLRGMWLGFNELQQSGAVSSVPQLFGVQAASCAPLVNAWSSSQWRRTLESGVETAPTTATAIADPLRGYERQGLLTLDAVAHSGGSIVAVSEESIHDAEKQLLSYGHWTEPSSATALAALAISEVKDRLSTAKDVVLMITGHGVKAGGSRQ